MRNRRDFQTEVFAIWDDKIRGTLAVIVEMGVKIVSLEKR